MFCCRRQRQNATPERMTLTIQIPKRTKWPPHEKEHIDAFISKASKSLNEINDMCFCGHRRFKAAIILFNTIIAQPAVLASSMKFRNVVLAKLEEVNAYVNNNDTDYFEEYEDMADRFWKLMEEIHNHPLYKE
jgi:hypothetical protein